MFLVLFYLQNLPQRGDTSLNININVNYILIKDIRLRQLLILNYIATDKSKDYDIYAIVGENSTRKRCNATPMQQSATEI